jgi:hypothetical protein
VTSILEYVVSARDEASAVFKKVSKAADEHTGAWAKLGAGATVAMAGAGLAVLDFAKKSVEKFSEAQQATNALDFAFEKFPAMASTNVAALDKLNEQIQHKTVFDHDALAQGEATLAQFKLTGAQVAEITPLVADYAAKTGNDIPTAATLVGKALLGNAKALKDIGIKYKATGDTAKDFNTIQGLLNQQVGGFAERQGKTAAGQATILKNAFGDLEEKTGSVLVPTLTKFTGVMTKVVDWLTKTPGALQGVAIGLGVAAAAWAVMTVAASPWLIIGVGIVAAIAGIVIAVQNWGKIGPWLKGIWDDVLRGIVRGYANVLEALANVLRALGHIPGFGWANDAANALDNAANKAKRFADQLGNIPKSVSVAVHLASDGSKVRIADTSAGSNVTTPLGTITAFAKGGIVTRPTFALIGEAGPEAVVPLSGRNGDRGQVRLHRDDLDYLAERMAGVVIAGANQVSANRQAGLRSAIQRRPA